MLAMKCITVTDTFEPFQMPWICWNWDKFQRVELGRLNYKGELSWNGVNVHRLYPWWNESM